MLVSHLIDRDAAFALQRRKADIDFFIKFYYKEDKPMLETFKNLICEYVEVNPDDITEDSRFIEDLHFNSYDFVDFLGAVETEFDITVDEQQIMELKTVGDAIAYAEKLSDK